MIEVKDFFKFYQLTENLKETLDRNSIVLDSKQITTEIADFKKLTSCKKREKY